LGIGLAKLGEADKLREAEIYLKKAAKLDPFNVKVLYNLGVVYFYQGKLKEARDAWEKALKIKPGDPLLQKALAELSLYEAKFKR
jgi:cytochrome c-type biogenesis protein CcmH/NrfG